MRQRGADIDLTALIELDQRHRGLISQVDSRRAELNKSQRAIGKLPPDQRAEAIAGNKKLSAELRDLESELGDVGAELERMVLGVPNLVHPDSPSGTGDIELRKVGAPREPEFELADHLTLGENLDVIDVKRASKVSGSRFAFLKGKGALLELALVRFALDRLMAEGFEPVIPPVLVKEDAMYGTGFFPTDEAQVYKMADDDLYLAGTSEVPMASMHSDEILPAKRLPLRYAGISTCFRREAGTYGKDTRGIIRVHQFDKVEMFSFCLPENSDEEHAQLLALEEAYFQALEIPYRVLEIAAGELAAPNYRKFDIEAWLPGADRWLEVTSCSNDWDFQARRLAIRTKRESGTEPVHTLNGTAVAVGRAIVALLENHQSGDGSVRIPEALRPYTGFEVIQKRT